MNRGRGGRATFNPRRGDFDTRNRSSNFNQQDSNSSQRDPGANFYQRDERDSRLNFKPRDAESNFNQRDSSLSFNSQESSSGFQGNSGELFRNNGNLGAQRSGLDDGQYQRVQNAQLDLLHSQPPPKLQNISGSLNSTPGGLLNTPQGILGNQPNNRSLQQGVGGPQTNVFGGNQSGSQNSSSLNPNQSNFVGGQASLVNNAQNLLGLPVLNLMSQQINNNQGLLGQQGSSNQGMLGQQRINNQGLLGQQGSNNQGLLGQQGSNTQGLLGQQGNQGLLNQQGNNNQGFLGRQGSSNQGLLGQQGNNNQGLLGQQGSNNQGLLGQQGSNNQGLLGQSSLLGQHSSGNQLLGGPPSLLSQHGSNNNLLGQQGLINQPVGGNSTLLGNTSFLGQQGSGIPSLMGPPGVLGQQNNQQGQFGNQSSLVKNSFGLSDARQSVLNAQQLLMSGPPPGMISPSNGSTFNQAQLAGMINNPPGVTGGLQNNLNSLSNPGGNSNSNQWNLLSGTNVNLSGLNVPNSLMGPPPSLMSLGQPQQAPQIGLGQLQQQTPQQLLHQQQLHQSNLQHMAIVTNEAIAPSLLGDPIRLSGGLMGQSQRDQSLDNRPGSLFQNNNRDRREVVLGRNAAGVGNRGDGPPSLFRPRDDSSEDRFRQQSGNSREGFRARDGTSRDRQSGIRDRLGNRGVKHGWSSADNRSFGDRKSSPPMYDPFKTDDDRIMSPPNKTRRLGGGVVQDFRADNTRRTSGGFLGNQSLPNSSVGPPSLLGNMPFNRSFTQRNGNHCDSCNKDYHTTSTIAHNLSTEHKKKLSLITKGCLLCKTGRFRNYTDYVHHLDGEAHKQKRFNLNVEKNSKPDESKSNLRQPSRPIDGGSKGGDNDKSVGADKRSIRSTGSNNKNASPAAKPSIASRIGPIGSGNKALSKEEPKNGTTSTPKGFLGGSKISVTGSAAKTTTPAKSTPPSTNKATPKLSVTKAIVRSAVTKAVTVMKNSSCTVGIKTEDAGKQVENIKEEIKSTGKMEDIRKQDVKIHSGKKAAVARIQPTVQDIYPEPNADEMVYDPNVIYGLQHVTVATGFFCKLCHKFFTNENLAKVDHCQSELHYQKYKAALKLKQSLQQRGNPAVSSETSVQAPVTQAPVRQVSGSQTPVSQVPGSQTPVSQVSGSQTPGSQVSESQASESQAPGSQAPADNVSADKSEEEC